MKLKDTFGTKELPPIDFGDGPEVYTIRVLPEWKWKELADQCGVDKDDENHERGMAFESAILRHVIVAWPFDDEVNDENLRAFAMQCRDRMKKLLSFAQSRFSFTDDDEFVEILGEQLGLRVGSRNTAVNGTT